MANLVIPNTFGANTLASAAEMNANFQAVETFCETELIHRDGAVAFTAVPSGPGTDPTTDNQFTRKAYVDSQVEENVGAGTIVHTVRSTAPTGWLFLDGSTISGGESLYPALWDVLPASMQSGSDILLPDASGRMLIGHDSADTKFDVIGETGGAETVTLTTTQLPAHTHTGTTAADAHTHAPLGGGNFLDDTSGAPVAGTSGGIGGGLSATTASDSHSHTFTTNSSGSGAAFSIMNPYITFNVMIRAF